MRVASFYRFLDLPRPAAFRDALQSRCDEQGLLGTILVAEEGFNGTLAGDERRIRAVLNWIERELSLDTPIQGRWTEATTAPLNRLALRVLDVSGDQADRAASALGTATAMTGLLRARRTTAW